MTRFQPERLVPNTSTGRDAETIDLLTDFVAETEAGLVRVDEILLQATRTPISESVLNEIFRVFHTIKGVSGFLDAVDIVRLAHVTETLLDNARCGRLLLQGQTLDVVFEASSRMRRLLDEVRVATEQGRSFASDIGLDTVIDKIAGVSPESLVSPPVSKAADSGVELLPTAAEPLSLDGQRAVRLRETVKVDLERIDSVVEMIGELLITQSMVVNAPEIDRLVSPRMRNHMTQLTKITRDLQSVAMRMRMIPLRGVFHKMARLTRDLARKTGKDVELVQVGEAIEMDRSIVERLEEPLVHMIRNAIDHAVESSAERRALGKSDAATIRLSAEHDSGSIAIEVSDDGRGLQREAILRKAIERGLVPEGAEHWSDEAVYALIFLPGFSTASQLSELSGRGVGMDVVKRAIEVMRGRILVRSKPGLGTTFRFLLPLTLAIIDGMLVSCGEETYVIPSRAIVESLEFRPELRFTLERNSELLNIRGEILTLLRLRRLVGFDEPINFTVRPTIVIVECMGKKLGLLVDEVLAEQQIVIKPLAAGLGEVELFAGSAILADGRVGLIINVDSLGVASRASRVNKLEHYGVE